MNHPSTALIQSRSGPWLKLIFKAPVYLYRLHLGWLLGHRFLMVSHRGRKTGKVRHTVLEVIRYDPASKERIVASGYGDSAAWYKNLQAEAALEIRTGFERYLPDQRLLEADERYQVMVDYERRHPRALRLFMKRLLGIPYDGSEVQKQALAARLPMVAFRPCSDQPRRAEKRLDESP